MVGGWRRLKGKEKGAGLEALLVKWFSPSMSLTCEQRFTEGLLVGHGVGNLFFGYLRCRLDTSNDVASLIDRSGIRAVPKKRCDHIHALDDTG